MTDGIGRDSEDGAGRTELEVEVSEAPEAESDDGGVPCAPPAASDSCAKPTDGGLELKTEYTFFCVQEETYIVAISEESVYLNK